MYHVHYLSDRGIKLYLDKRSGKLEKSKTLVNIGRERLAEQIINTVYTYFGVPKEDIKAKNRKTNWIRAKQFSCYFIKKEIPVLTLVDIGSMFLIDHSTVIHSCRKIEGLIEVDKEYRNFEQDLILRINNLYK